MSGTTHLETNDKAHHLLSGTDYRGCSVLFLSQPQLLYNPKTVSSFFYTNRLKNSSPSLIWIMNFLCFTGSETIFHSCLCCTIIYDTPVIIIIFLYICTIFIFLKYTDNIVKTWWNFNFLTCSILTCKHLKAKLCQTLTFVMILLTFIGFLFHISGTCYENRKT